MARKRINVISMSFLDAMTCGFGAVILFFMIIAANIDLRHDSELEEASAEVSRMEIRVLAGRNNLVQMREDLSDEIQQLAVLRGVREELVDEIRRTSLESEEIEELDESRRAVIESLREELAALEVETERLSAESITPEEAGDRIRSVTGEGNRQYLTGLRMGGERVAIIVDVSTSMLDRRVVNVLTGRRTMSDEQKRRAPKWQQLVNTVDWLTAQITPGTQVQIIAFNDRAWSLLPDGQPVEQEQDDDEYDEYAIELPWVTVTDGSQLEAAVQALRELVPSGGTNLHAPFIAMRNLQPSPDNVYLLVDGLPTRGTPEPTRAGVTSRERQRHFDRAVREIRLRVPINVILLPMEGDPFAAPSYWLLALQTGGSMLAPSEDWP